MSEDIIIYPYGDFANKLMSLMAAIDLQLRTKKKIKIVYSLSYNDLVWDGDSNLFMDQLPEFNFKNISYVYQKKKAKANSALLKNLLISDDIGEELIKLSKNKKLELYDFGVLYNKYPTIDKGIIRRTWIQGFKNDGAPLVKKWLSDITKFKYYKEYIKDTGFDWYDSNYEYVEVYFELGDVLKYIFNHSATNKFILKPEWYDKALRILKNKTKKPLKIILHANIPLNINLLFKYVEIIKKHGDIINDFQSGVVWHRNLKLSQVDKILTISKVDHFIGPRNFIQVGSYLYAKNHSVTIINSNNVLELSYKKEDCPPNWIILNDENYRIMTIRDLQRYNLDILVGLKQENLSESININRRTLIRSRNYIQKKYNSFYNKFNKYIDSKVLKDLLLYKTIETKDKVYTLNSNISVDEGLFLFNLIKKYNPKNIIEIGLACGVSAAFILLAMDKKSKLTSVDPFQKFQWEKFGLVVVDKIIKESKLKKSNHKWEPYYSHTFFSKKNSKYDLCFIDGDHSYEGTMIDLVGCHNLLEKNGLLVIDDVLHFPVKKAINDFMSKNNNNYKIIDSDIKTMNGYIKLL